MSVDDKSATTVDNVAVFIDVENIRYSAMNIHSEPVPNWAGIAKQCQKYGRISSFQAFDDWSKFPSHEVHEVQRCGIQPIFVPQSEWNKSSLDFYLTVAAMKLFFQNDSIDTLILASGDRDYIPLVIELRALGKKVLIMSVEDTLSRDLEGSVDDVFFYNPKEAPALPASAAWDDNITKEQGQQFLIDTLQAEERENGTSHGYGWITLANLGHRLKRNRPDFTHKDHGYHKLVDMLKETPGIELKYDDHEKLVAMARTKRPDAPARMPGETQAESQKTTFFGSVISVKDNGYGFIKPDGGGEHLFFHYTKVIGGDIYALDYGDRVSYEVYNTDRGPNAERVEKADSKEPQNPVMRAN